MSSTWDNEIYFGGSTCIERVFISQSEVTIPWTLGGLVLCADLCAQPGVGRATALWVLVAPSSRLHITQGSSSALCLQLAGGVPDKTATSFVLCCFDCFLQKIQNNGNNLYRL